MSTILPFRKPSARISPQHDPSRVAVNVTAIQRELARDMFNEAEARVLARVWRARWVANDPGERAAWDAFMAADRRARGMR